MVQRKKPEVRDGILAAARRQFAVHGAHGGSLAAIAADAGTSVGNLYKYFADKDALLAAAVRPETATRLRSLLRQQVEALGAERDVDALADDHPYRRAAAETRAFSAAHREELLYLLRHGEGTAHPRFADDVAADLERLSLAYVERAYSDFPATAANRRAIRRIYRAYVLSIADMLAEERSDRALAEATRKLTAYHLSGLRSFFAAASEKTS